MLNLTKILSKRLVQGSQMNAFCEVLEHCHLEDLGFRGYKYTWNNKRPGEANTRVCLDRATTTVDWRVKFSLSTVYHLSSHASDHYPSCCMFKVQKNGTKAGRDSSLRKRGYWKRGVMK